MTVPASPRSNHSSDKRNHQYDGWRAREETRLPFTLSILDSFTCSSWSSYAEGTTFRGSLLFPHASVLVGSSSVAQGKDERQSTSTLALQTVYVLDGHCGQLNVLEEQKGSLQTLRHHIL
ncbi:hypothetical protein WG66_013281 [Moniliophthora roreri]|nr:hypothetical protein WG66_013281 [Moniliophthora roreri]